MEIPLKYIHVKNTLLLTVLLFAVNIVSSQIFVSNNASLYIFNKGTYIYDAGNLELNGPNSNFYLRNEGQFLQATAGAGANTGIGKLSVFQEGTVNNYAYNYWCSPVGNASAAIGNEPFGITMFNVPTTSTASNAASTTISVDGVSSAGSLTISSRWIYKLVGFDAYSDWTAVIAASTINAGEGFTMKGTSGSDATAVGETAVNNPVSAQRYDFRGKPNDGTITIPVTKDLYTLTGNPYPSAIDLSAFLLGATNSTGATGL